MSVVEDYQAQTEALAAATAAQMLALYAALQAGGLSPPAATEAMAAVVNVANAAATTLADLFVTAQIEVASREPAPPTGIAPTDDGPRLTKAVATILDDLDDDEPDDLDDGPAEERADDEPAEEGSESSDAEEPAENADPVDTAAMRLERLARAEPLDTGQDIVVEIINRLPQVEGWTRVLDADPCERCQRWAEDGRVFPKDAHFKRHLNCNCQQQIVMTTPGEMRSGTEKMEKPA
ncbi:hypothetical protein [Mycolicibacterium psychrotolerans]|uniref:MuF-like minor capsid protein n=1 Tax=Mycolicibacterium psychrotolerans TaxID=216929 RepID=A0A7I7MBC8_9MYCO|nr:hypothetical protein [Mycolicibacterium psychrotolerans]BBX69591.1 hypothetical protein MPSYJ_30520 [Mycolicibacterium psychrotolerans]